MRARSWMAYEPVTVAPDVSVRDARKLMRLRGIRHLPVVEGDRVVGMVSDRDVRISDTHLEDITDARDVAHVAGEARSVREVMSAPVHVVPEHATIEEAARVMLSRRVSAVPVVTETGNLVGLLTTTDCLLAFLSPPTDDADAPP
jgi:acetoin utilization protein AcuB